MTHIPAQIIDILAYLPSDRLRSLKNHVEVSDEMARKFFKSKAAALEEGKVGKDVLSLIGTFSLRFVCGSNLILLWGEVRANTMENEKLRLTDEELLPQVASVFLMVCFAVND